jgi:hypothetical protein
MNFISKLFKPKHHSSDKVSCNSITFKIDQDQKIHLHIDIENLSSADANKFGLMLFLLNEGYYVQTFMDLMTDLSKQDLTKAQFVQQVIGNWSKQITESNEYEDKLDNEPIIKPTLFNNTNK